MPESADIESVNVVDHFSKLIEILKKERNSLPMDIDIQVLFI